ncbi:MAG: hypothetical protein FVQ83_03070 [Chloroflexi bacterium]|nr:hypothetical protein [Chloroflexota bacterium]
MAKSSLVDADSLLAVEIGTVNTRALLFDAVEGNYRFLASGTSTSTVAAPMYDAGEGVRMALDQLHNISGRLLVGMDERLMMPSTPDGSGIDRFSASLSAGQPLKVAAVGLLDDVSLKSVRRLVGAINSRIVETLSLDDRRKPEAQIDSIIRLRPDIVVIAGGTNNGASRSVLKLINTLGMALHLLPANFRPEVLYAGNENLGGNVTSFLENLVPFSIVPNLRPNHGTEQLGPAELMLTEIFRKIHGRKTQGIQELDTWASGMLQPTSIAFGRVIRFLSRVYDPTKGVLGIDVGASSTTVASSFSGDLRLKVYSRLGMGESLVGLVNRTKLEDITRWIPLDVPDDYVANYIYNKAIYPASLPATRADLAIEQALAREVIRAALSQAKETFPKDLSGPKRAGLLPWFEPIIAAGSVIAHAPSFAQSLLMILDGVEPTGITKIILDKNNIAPALGTAAVLNSILAVQVLESSSFINLGTVISPVGKARQGSPVLRLKIIYDSGQENIVDVKNGALQTIPLPPGRSAQLHIQPLHRFDVGMGGPGKSGRLRVSGSYFGIVIDARGRPIRHSASPDRRRELLVKWHKMLET